MVLIQGAAGFPVDQRRLIFAGKQLEYERELNEYGIGTGCNFHFVCRLKED